MRSEHKLTGIEEDALTKAHQFYGWRSITRRQIKRMAHRIDRRQARSLTKAERMDYISSDDPEKHRAYHDDAMRLGRLVVEESR